MNEDCKRKEAAGSSSDQKKYDFNISKLACLLEFKMRMKEIAITITLQNEIGIKSFYTFYISTRDLPRFFVQLGIKPLMHLLKISIFLLNNDLVRLTKIMNNLVIDLKF